MRKILIVLLLACIILVSGCVGETQSQPKEKLKASDLELISAFCDPEYGLTEEHCERYEKMPHGYRDPMCGEVRYRLNTDYVVYCHIFRNDELPEVTWYVLKPEDTNFLLSFSTNVMVDNTIKFCCSREKENIKKMSYDVCKEIVLEKFCD